MSIEHKEDISVEQDKLSVLLRTEQTTVEKEVFESIEQALDRKSKERWAYTGASVVFLGAGAVFLIDGLSRLSTTIDNGDSGEVVIGGGLIVLGSYFIYNIKGTIKSFDLAKRQEESLQTMLDRNTDIVDPMQDNNES